MALTDRLQGCSTKSATSLMCWLQRLVRRLPLHQILFSRLCHLKATSRFTNYWPQRAGHGSLCCFNVSSHDFTCMAVYFNQSHIISIAWFAFLQEKQSFCLKHDQLLTRRTGSHISQDNVPSPADHYSNGKCERARTESKHLEDEENSEKQGTDSKLISKIDKITKFVYPAAYVIFNIVYWYQLND